MKSFHTALSVSALALMIGGALTSQDASAVTQSRSLFTNPTGVCQSALPTFDGVIRKRPLAVQNEGTTDSFVTCSYAAQGGPGVTRATIEFSNANDGVRLLTCTGIAGYAGNAQTEYLTKNIVLQPNNVIGSLVWDAADFQGAPATFPSVNFSISCKLEPGIGINRSRIDFLEDVGA